MHTNLFINGALVPGGDEALSIAIANAGRCGLASSVSARNVGRAMEVAGRLRFDLSWVNTHGVAKPEVPWSATSWSRMANEAGR